jgi:ribosome-binding factor A
MTQRTNRIDQLLREEIGQIVSRELTDPRIGFVTITDVETTPDLRHARVWVSVIGSDAERRESLRALARAMPFVRHELGHLRLKRIPELHVKADDTLERGTRVLRLISELESGSEPDSIDLPEGTLPTPVARLPHEGDTPEEEPSAVIPPVPRKPGPRSPRSGPRSSDPRRSDPRRPDARRKPRR